MFGSEKYRGFVCHPGYNGGGSGGGSSTTVSEIPDELKPLATAYTGKAINLGEQEFNPYTDQRYAELNPTQYQGLDMVQQRALGGSATMDNAEANLNQMMNAGPNPWLDQMYDQAAGNVMKNVNSNFALGGRLGSNAHADTYSENLGDLATQMYGGAYAQDQNNRLQAMGMAPTFGNAPYQDASQLLNAGQIMQDQAQNNLDFGYEQYQEEENLPYKQLAAMSGVFGSNLGSSSKTQSSGGGK